MIEITSGLLLALLFWNGPDLKGQKSGACPANPSCKWCLLFSNPDDSGQVVEEKLSVRVEIRSPKGIGKAKVIGSGPWPSRVILRLHLGGLEHLEISSEKIALEVAVQSYEPFRRFIRVTRVPEGLSDPGSQEPGDPLWVEIQARNPQGKDCRGLPPKNGYWEIVLPPAFLQAAGSEIHLRWIDFYR
jgi:hypothetical protein